MKKKYIIITSIVLLLCLVTSVVIGKKIIRFNKGAGEPVTTASPSSASESSTDESSKEGNPSSEDNGDSGDITDSTDATYTTTEDTEDTEDTSEGIDNTVAKNPDKDRKNTTEATEAQKPKATTEAPKPKATTEAPKPKPATTETPKPATTEAPKPKPATTETPKPATTEATTEGGSVDAAATEKQPKLVWHDPVYKTVTEEVPVYKDVEIMETVYCSICNKCGTILHTQDDIDNHFYGNYDCGSYRSYQYQRGTGKYETVVWCMETVEKKVLVQEGYWEEVYE